MRKTLIMFSFTLLGGCVTQYQGDEKSPHFVVPAGSTVILHRELQYPPDEVGVYFQNGKIVAKALMDLYRPHCRLELYHKVNQVQTVKPDRFTVLKATQEILHSVQLPVMLAGGARRPHPGIGFTSDIPGPELMATRMMLQNPQQPNVYSLTCGHLESPPVHAAHLTIQQIRQALGDIITLQIRAPS